jgi:hypothetical protein
MRKSLIPLPLLFVAAPAWAQAAPPRLPPELQDPRVADRIADAVQGVSQAMLNIKVGAVEAAIEGREPTAAEKKMTVRDLGRRDDPNFDRNFHERMAQVRPTIERGMKTLNTALPAMMKALDEASEAIDRAAANMPDPTYPKR